MKILICWRSFLNERYHFYHLWINQAIWVLSSIKQNWEKLILSPPFLFIDSYFFRITYRSGFNQLHFVLYTVLTNFRRASQNSLNLLLLTYFYTLTIWFSLLSPDEIGVGIRLLNLWFWCNFNNLSNCVMCIIIIFIIILVIKSIYGL